MRFSLYGLLVGLATVAVWSIAEHILRRETRAKDWPDTTWMQGLVFLLLGALIGARAYHVITDWPLYASQPWPAVVQVWNGGLGWYGGLVGLLLGTWAWRLVQSPRLTWLQLLDAFALALPWGQALGRWGNYFNQEIFGPPTSLPWGIFIAPERRPEIWQSFERFHPLFLYESLGMLLLGFGLVWTWHWGRKQAELPWLQFGHGTFLASYCLGFGSLRFLLDLLRSDLTLVSGLSVSQWFSLGLIGLGLVLLQRNFSRWVSNLVPVLVGVLVGVMVWSAFSKLVSPLPVWAQESAIPVDLTLTPAVVEITIQPGKSVTRAFTLKNNGTENLNVVLSLRDFASDYTTGSPVLIGGSAFPYASFANSDRRLNEQFLLPAGGEQQIVLALNIPEDAPQQDWYLVLLAQTEPTQRDPLIESRASSQGSIGATLLIRISNTEQIPLRWGVTFPKLPRFLDSLRPLPIEPLVENLNPTLAVPVLTIQVRNWRGEVVHTQAGLPERVLAKSTRFIRAQKASADDARSLEPTPFVFDPLFALGPYTIEAHISNQAGEPLLVTQEVVALPFSLGLFALALILAWKGVPLLRRKKIQHHKR